MSVDLKPYPAMKDSGVPWLGAVPEHWEVRRLGTSVHGCINGIWGNDPNGREDLPCVRVADFDRARLRVRLAKPTLRAVAPGERKRRLLKKSDLLLEKSGGGDLQPVGVVMLYDHDIEAVCSNFVARMPVSARCNSSYLTYLHSHLYAIRLNVRSIKQTTGIQNLDSSSYLGEPVAFPPLAEQAAIVRFLDHADRRIRRYIHAKHQLIALLEEQKQAIIHQAVTRGLDPNVRLKPSGVEWLGQVPTHWEVLPNRALFDEVKERDHPEEAMLSVTITKGVIRQRELLADSSKKDSSNQDKSAYKFVRPGDIAYNKMRAWQGAVGVSDYHGIVSPAYVVERPRDGTSSRYLHYLLRTPAFAKEAERWSYGITSDMWSLRPEHFKMIYGCLPPLSEQAAIVSFLDRTTTALDAATASAQRETALLREYRTRLIADVVTGKLDVREAAARLPDEVEELEPLDEADALIGGEEEPADALATAP